MTTSSYDLWLEANFSDMENMWAEMSSEERHEEGDFDTFCRTQFDDGYGQ
jgi:hypothetical protein